MSQSGPLPMPLLWRLLAGQGLTALVRAQLQGAEFAPMATWSLRGGRYCAQVDFLAPIGEPPCHGVVVQLPVMPDVGGEAG